jgi:hypothetical protein
MASNLSVPTVKNYISSIKSYFKAKGLHVTTSTSFGAIITLKKLVSYSHNKTGFVASSVYSVVSCGLTIASPYILSKSFYTMFPWFTAHIKCCSGFSGFF